MKKIILISLIMFILCGCATNDEVDNSPVAVVIENEEPTSEINNVYYYNLLSDKQKQYYDLLLVASSNYENKISGSFKFNSDDFTAALFAFSSDYPIYYWWRNGVNTSYTDDSFTSTSSDSKNNAEENINKLIEIKDDILSQCLVENNYETIKNIHDYLVNIIDYDTTNENAHNIVGSLIEHKAVCDGYSLAFKYLLNEAGFNCNIIEGQAIENTNLADHAWNIVELNNKWYLCDITWDDQEVNDENDIGKVYDYFMITDEIMYTNHFPRDMYAQPACSDESLLYINMPGAYIKEYDEEKISGLLELWLSQGYKDFYLRFKDYEESVKAHQYLLENGEFVEIFKRNNSSYDISYGGELNTVSHVLHIYYREVENN